MRKKLENRKSDKNAKWFEYGRSQALKNSNQEKLLLSTSNYKWSKNKDFT